MNVTIDVFDGFDRVVEEVEQESETDATSQRKQKRDDDVAQAWRTDRALWQSAVGRDTYFSAAVSIGQIKFTLPLGKRIEQLLVRFQLLREGHQVDRVAGNLCSGRFLLVIRTLQQVFA